MNGTGMSHQWLTGVIDSIEDGAAIFDADDRLVLFNEKYTQYFLLIRDILKPGISFNEMLQALAGRGLYDGPESGEADWVAHRVKQFADGETENEFQRIDGRWVRVGYYKLQSGGTFVVYADFTGRKESEEALRTSESQYRAIAGVAPVGISHTDLDGNLTYVNDKWCPFGRMNAEATMGKGWLEALHPDDRDRVSAEWYRLTEASIKCENAYRYVNADGAYTWCFVQAFTEPDEAGNIISFVGALTDFNQRKRYGVELQESEARLLDAIENIPDAFILFDADERMVVCNSKYREIFPEIGDILLPGANLEDLVRSSAERGPVAEAVGNVDGWVQKRLQQTRTSLETYEQQLGDGRWILSSDRRTRDGGIVGIRTDITAMKQTEEKLRQAQKMEAVGQLTGGIAHDFNNLLAVIMGNVELLRRRLGKDDKRLRKILHATERGAELTRRLLAYSRNQPLEPQAVDTGALVHEMGELLRRTLGETIQVEITADMDLWLAQADPGQIENAILNLAINARDAMPMGGALSIKCGNETLDEAYADSHSEVNPGDYILISVTDSGAGMSAEVQAHALEPFFTTKDVGEGSGLGLPMVYDFAKQSGGYLVISSQEDQGTTIKLYLPRAVVPGDRAEPVAETEAPRGQGEIILVVEDEVDVRELTEVLLDSLGYRVLAARNGYEALKILDEEPKIDLLLCDVILPGGISGPDMADMAWRSNASLKVLYMSGYAEDMIHQRSSIPEGVNLLHKPFHIFDLATRIRAVLDC